MAIIKKSELRSMNDKAKEEKIKELKLELVKAAVTANKTNAKTKELKRTIARLLTKKISQEVKPKQ